MARTIAWTGAHVLQADSGRGKPGYYPGVVEDGIDSAKLGDGLLHQRRHLGLVAHIAMPAPDVRLLPALRPPHSQKMRRSMYL